MNKELILALGRAAQALDDAQVIAESDNDERMVGACDLLEHMARELMRELQATS